MAAENFNPFFGMSQYRNPTGPQSNFTFTAPTQCTTLGTPRPCIETMSPINLSAPGVGASWQHSIPTTMPWVDLNSPAQNVTVGSATVFTGMPFNIYSSTVPSGNNTPRRSKRKALDVPLEAPMSKVHLCADQLANMRITPSHHSSSETSQQLDKFSNKLEEWDRFRELENRLAADGDDDVDKSPMGSLQDGGIQFHVNDGVINVNTTSSPLLPRKVMEEINKPCMQLVVWQSPEKLIRDITNEEGNAGSHSSSTKSLSPVPTSSLSTALSLSVNASSVSTFPNSTISSDCLAGSTGMDMSSEHSVDPFRFNSVRDDSSFPPSSLGRQTSSACQLAPSPDFLRPVSSSSGLPFLPSASSSYFTPRGIANPMNLRATHSSDFLNNNNVHSNNNNNLHNVVDMFDSVDDEMQL